MTLDDALHAPAKMDARKRQVIELRFSGRLTVGETAVVPGGITGYNAIRGWPRPGARAKRGG